MFEKKLKRSVLWLALVLLVAQVFVFADATPNYAVEISGVGVKTVLQLTLADLKAMPAEAQINEAYTYNSRTGEKSSTIKGVSLAYVLKEKAGVTATEAQVLFTASDAYPIDPQPLSDVLNPALQYVLAYEIDGNAIDNDGNASNEEITVYRKVKTAGEFGTVFKMVVSISVGEGTTTTTPDTPVTPETPVTAFTDITEGFKYAETAINTLVQKGIVAGVGNGQFAPQNSLTRAQISKMMVLSLGYELKPYTGGFSDVKTSDWFAPYVQTAVDNGLFTGYTDGSFKPNQTINRQEISAVSVRTAVKAGVVNEAKVAKFVMEKSNYTDKASVPSWAANQVAWLEAQGVFADIATTTFEPAKTVNRGEAAAIVYNTLFK